MSTSFRRSSPLDAADAESIEGWRERLQQGEPWERIEGEILEYTGADPEALLSLLLTAHGLGGIAAQEPPPPAPT
jgi:hypothetical protein